MEEEALEVEEAALEVAEALEYWLCQRSLAMLSLPPPPPPRKKKAALDCSKGWIWATGRRRTAIPAAGA